MIKNLVLSGGAYLGLIQFGVLKQLQASGFYNIKNIEKIYGTSIGGFIGAMLCLKININDLTENFTDRPWQNLLKFNPSILSDFYLKKGIIDKSICKKATHNLLESVDLSCDITLQELYNYSNIELHFYTTSLNDFCLKDISYKTHPNMLLLDAIYITCSIPYIFQPLEIDGETYVDGGLLCNYPIQRCLETNNKEETLGLYFYNNNNNKNCVTNEKQQVNIENQNLLEFCYYIHMKLLENKNEDIVIPEMKNQVKIPCDNLSMDHALDLIFNKELRRLYVENGEKIGKDFLKSMEPK